MSRYLAAFFLLLCLALGAGAQTITAAPSLFNFQGRLATPSGNPVPDGTYSVTLSLWDAASGGNKRWEQVFANVAVKNGTFAAQLNLGSGFTAGNTIDTAINGSTYLEIKIGTDAALTPRQQLVSTPYALKANTVPDGSITGAKIAAGTITADKLAGSVLTGVAGGDLTGNYPNPQLRTGADLLAKVSGNLMTAIGAGTVLDAQQILAPLVGVDYAWQSFTASASGVVTSIDIWCGTTGANKAATLVVYDGEGTAGTILRTYNVTLTPTVRFQTFTVSVPVVGGQKYTWQLGTSASTRYGYASGDPYTGGKSDLGDTLDYAFRTFLQGSTSPQITSAANLLVNGSWLGISNNHYLEFGYGVAGKEVNAGKIGYGLFTANALDIVGAGTSGTNRAIMLHAEGGTTFTGNLQIPVSKMLTINQTDTFTHAGNTIGHYSLGWYNDAWDTGGPTGYLSAYSGFKFFSLGVPRVAITDVGNVGIGTTTPNVPFQVVGSNPFPHARISSAASAPYGAFLSLDATANPGGKDWLIYSTGGTAGEGQGKLVFQNSTNSTIAMMMASGGNIGIGVSPGTNAKLHVRGRAYIEGDSGGSFGSSPTISLAIGDNDTGLNWGGDGNLQFYANGSNTAQLTPGAFNVSGNLSATNVYGNYVQSNGSMYSAGYFTAAGSGTMNGAFSFNNGDNNCIVATNSSSSSNYPTIYSQNNGNSSRPYTFYSPNGILSSPDKRFIIDHPLDPANKTLEHACVESDERRTMYTGTIVLNGEGEAWVQMPDYMETLNKDFTYQLTAIGGPGRDLYIAQEMTKNRFQIAGGKAGMKVSWTVTGVRQDAWAKAYPFKTEQDKGVDRGLYLTPRLFGQPDSKGGVMQPHNTQQQSAPQPKPVPQSKTVATTTTPAKAKR